MNEILIYKTNDFFIDIGNITSLKEANNYVLKNSEKNDSKNLWLNIDNIIPFKNFSLGRYTTQALFDDPASISFISSRYKFCAKLLSNKKNLLSRLR